MKKLILSLLACGTVAAASAQAGLLLYGTGTYASSRGSNDFTTGGVKTTTDLERNIYYQVAPGIGWSLNKNLAIGLDINFSGGKYTPADPSNTNPYEVKSYDLGVGPFVRYTQMLSEHFFVFGQFSAHYLRGNVKSLSRPNIESEDSYSGVDASLVPALGVRVSPTVALSFGVGGVGFRYTKTEMDAAAGTSDENKNSAFGVTFGRQFNITLQKYCNWHVGGHRNKGTKEPMEDTRQIDTSDDGE